MAYKWRNYEGVIARLVPKEDIKGLIKQDVVVGPGEQAIIIRNGKIEDSVTQTRLERLGGGFSNWLKAKLGMGEDLEILFVDTKEIDIEIAIKGISKEHDEVKGTATLRIRIDPTQATKLISLIRAMPPTELFDTIKDYGELEIEEPLVKSKELFERIKKYPSLVKMIKKHNLLPASYENIEKIYQKMGEGMELTREEKKILKKSIKIIKHYEKREKLNWYAGMVLLKEDLSAKIEGELNAKVLQYYIPKYSSEEIKRNPEVRETMERIMREELRKTFNMWGIVLLDFYTILEASAYEELEQHRRNIYLEIDRMSLDTLPDFAMKMTELEREHTLRKRELELKIEEEMLQHRGKQDKEWMEHVEEMKELFGDEYIKKYGIPGWMDVKERLEQWRRARNEHEVELRIKEFQATVLAEKQLQAEVEKEKARMETEKAKYSLETYERGIEKERERTKEMMDRSAKLMQAAKQNLPNTLVQGQATPVLHVGEGREEKEFTKTCPSCGKPVSEEWNVCPYCGAKLK